MDAALAQALWTGPLPNPAAPAAALARDLAGGLGYGPLVARLRQLARHGLPLEPALSPAMAAHPGSIDLALVAVQAGAEGALEALAARVARQNRRHAALAWALWSQGRGPEARAALARLDPGSDSHGADLAARAELAILSGDDPGPLAGPQAARLELLHLYRRQGPAALAARFDAGADALPADPALWSWLIDGFVTAGDFARARHALPLMADRLGEGHHALRAQRIHLALEGEDIPAARRLLDAEGDGDRPWLWPARRLAQHLRCLIAEAAGDPTGTALRHAADTAEAAARLLPGHAPIAHLRIGTALACGNWDALAQDWCAPAPGSAERAAGLGRLGLPEAALAALDAAPDGPPDAMTRLRLRRAELHLMRGAPQEAARALGPAPADQALRPNDAYWRAEIALARRDGAGARAVLDAALATAPTHMGLLLSRARALFLAGEFGAAGADLDRFRALKTAQLGAPPPDDLRDRITADAAQAQNRGRAETDSPGLAARALALATPAFTACPGAAIPRHLAHYWEGPAGPAVLRGQRAWAARHPGFEQRLFDAATAAVWLARHAPNLSALFARQHQPATRADLFRLAWIAHHGGVFADLDEYPRAPVADWLTGARAVLVIEAGYGTVANNFLAAEPGLPLFARALDRVARALGGTDSPYPWWHSGPAQLTPPALAASRDADQRPGLRFLDQMAYNARVSTNLPFPHKRGPDHWR